MKKEAAENIAVDVLGFLAADSTRLARFLDLSGLAPGSIRAAASDPQFLAGILDYIHTDEALLKALAASHDIEPATIERARATLGGRAWERDVP